MKRLYRSIVPALVLLFVLVGFLPGLVQATTSDFTADGDITVSNINLGDSQTTTLTILNLSTAESWNVTNGVLTVTNPGTTFKISSTNSDVKSIKSVRNTNYSAECVDNSTPGTTSITLLSDTSTYTITPQVASCAGNGTSGQGGGTTGGGGGGGGAVTPTVTSPAVSDLGTVGTGNKTTSLALNAQSNFTTTVSGGGSGSHSVKVNALDLVNKKVTLIVQSNPVTFELSVGETKNVDLDGDGIYDISVKFNDLVASKADLIIANISAASQAADDTGLKSGDLIKTANSSAVYYISNDGKKHLFVNEVTFWTWYSGKWSKIMDGDAVKTVKVVTQTDFDKLTNGANITVKPASKLIKFENSPRVYVVDAGASLRQVVNSSNDDSVAKALYGTGYKQKIITIQTSFESNYVQGNALTAVSVVPTETIAISKLFE